LIIGVTGGIGCGKTEISRIFGDLGAHVIDADDIVHDLYLHDEILKRRIADTFGSQILHDGLIDRKLLSHAVIGNIGMLEKLNEIVHGRVEEEIIDEIGKNKNSGLIVLDVPIPVKKGFTDICDIVVVVKSSMKNRMARIMKRDSFSAAEAKKRIGSQIPQRDYEKIADVLIVNDGDISELEQKVKELYRRLL
jgi:dephospho-CoA kinase